MATSNFNYYHRCIIVTNDDLEIENHPNIDNECVHIGYPLERNYPMHALSDYSDWEIATYIIGLSFGYYGDACITAYPIDNGDIYDQIMLYQPYECTSKKELIDLLNDYISDYKMSYTPEVKKDITKIVNGIAKEMNFDFKKELKLIEKHGYAKFEAFIDKVIMDTFIPNLKYFDLKIVDQELNKIKEDYGYEEATLLGVASNGEAFYKKL